MGGGCDRAYCVVCLIGTVVVVAVVLLVAVGIASRYGSPSSFCCEKAEGNWE